MATLFNFYSAKNAKVRFNGGVWVANMWTVTETPDEIDTSNFEANGFSDAIHGLLTLRVTIEFPVVGDANPWDLGYMVPTVIQGSLASYPTNLKLYLNDTSGPGWWLPVFMIGEVSTPSDVKQNGKGSVKIRNKGLYVRPTGVIAA